MTEAQNAPVDIHDDLRTDERAELERLRQENSTLRAAAKTPRARIRWRSVVAAVLIVLSCALAPVSVVAVWTHEQVSDTDSFVAAARPLIDDPAVQEALTNRITTTLLEYLDVQQLSEQVIAALSAQGLPPLLVRRLTTFTPTLAAATTQFVRDKVGRLVESPQISAAWEKSLRIAHQQLVAVLSGDSRAVVVQNGMVYLDLAPFIDAAKQRLADDGLTAVSLIPEVHPTIGIAPADQLVRAQSAYGALDSVAPVLPWITALLVVVGVYLARIRTRALVAAALGIGLALVVLAAGLLVARGLLVSAVPAGGAVAAASAFDILVRSLRSSGRVLLVLVLVLALGAFLAGSSTTAMNVRRRTSGLAGRVWRGPSETGALTGWTRAHLRGLRIGAVAFAAVIFVFVPQPTGATILIIVAGMLVGLAVIEVVARPAPQGPGKVVT